MTVKPRTRVQMSDRSIIPWQQIRVVAFDAVGTLMYATPSVSNAYRNALARHGEPLAAADNLGEILWTALSDRSATDDLRTNEEDEREFWWNLISRLCSSAESAQACFDELFAHFASAASWSCYPDVDDVIRKLRQHGMHVAVGSNFDRRLNSVCDGLPPLSAIADRFISSIVGWRKPARQFFQTIADRYGCRPDEILFVGDDLRNDVAGAVNAGCHAAFIDRKAIQPMACPAELDGIRFTQINELSQLLPG